MAEPQPPHIDLLLTSPRVAAGLLSHAAWLAVTEADQVWCADPADPTAVAIADARADVRAVSVEPAALARSLIEASAAHRVLWVGSADGDPGLTDALAAELSRIAGGPGPVPAVEVIVGSHDVPGARLLDVVAVMDQLRSPGGCPWDAEQTPQTLAPYLLEECHEALEAIEQGNVPDMLEELGDVLLQVVFQARIAADGPGAFDIDDIAAGLVDKLIRRHPHVFAEPTDTGPATAAEVEHQWQRLKAVEKQRTSLADGIPLALPALARAAKLVGRLRRSTLSPAAQAQAVAATGDPLADRLLAEVLGYDGDPEAVLRAAVRTVEGRIRALEAAG